MIGRGKMKIQFSLFVSFICAATDRRPVNSLNSLKIRRKRKIKTIRKFANERTVLIVVKCFIFERMRVTRFSVFEAFLLFSSEQKKAIAPPPPPPKQMEEKTQNTNHSQILRILIVRPFFRRLNSQLAIYWTN